MGCVQCALFLGDTCQRHAVAVLPLIRRSQTRVPMNEQLQPLKKQPRAGKAGRSGTQDDIVYAHIFEAILEQRLAPGTKLSEEALGEIFGVSRTIIRRALSRLAHESVVLLRPNRGAVVASPSVEEARQVFMARRLVERAITELAVQHATAEQLAELRQMVNDERDSFSRGDRGAGIRLRRIPLEAGGSCEERAADQLPAQPGVPDVIDHRPVRKRQPLALLLR